MYAQSCPTLHDPCGLQAARLLCAWHSLGKNPGVTAWMHETRAQGWCTGKTQRDGMGREAGGGIRMGNTCKSMADSCQCMAETTTIL